MYVTINRKTMHVDYDDELEKERKKKYQRLLYRQAQEAKRLEAERKRLGVCLDCNLQLPITRKCPKCGTVWIHHPVTR